MSDFEGPGSLHLRILLADDAWATINSIRLMLRLLPDVEVVATARNGRQAIEMTVEYKPDIALVDINMPEVNGLLAMQAMLEHHPDIVCIAMSVEGDSTAVKEAQSSGAIDYLIKPFTTEELLDTLERAGRLVSSRRPLDSETAELRRKVTAPLRTGQTSLLREERTFQLQQLAANYIKARRTDDEVIEVLEELAANPNCEIHWLRSLAMIYVIRENWRKLRFLADRLVRLVESSNADARSR
mgnify:FL=1